jgi:Holliday junction DNA helicase RuvB
MIESSFKKEKKEKIFSASEKDPQLEFTLRPQTIADYIGQSQIKENLKIFIEAAKKRQESLEHVLIHGPAGLGKTTLSHVIANEMGKNFKPTSGPAIERVGDLASILTNLEDGDVLFIDEIHRINKLVEEALYPAMEDYKLDIIIGKGPSAKTLQLDLPRFTLIGATTRAGLISSPLRSRFGISYRLDFYSDQEISQIIERSGKLLKVPIEKDGLSLIAKCSRKNPRVANRLLKRVRDISQIKGTGTIDHKIAQIAFKMLEIDETGLENADRLLLDVLIKKFNGGPAGISALAAATGEEKDTLEEVYEPYLIKIGFLERTPRGRIATPEAYSHLGLSPEKLF